MEQLECGEYAPNFVECISQGQKNLMNDSKTSMHERMRWPSLRNHFQLKLKMPQQVVSSEARNYAAAQCYLILAHLQHSKFDTLYISHNLSMF